MTSPAELRAEMEGHLGVILLAVRRLELLLQKLDAMQLAVKKAMEQLPPASEVKP